MLKNEARFVIVDERKKIYLDVSVTICRTTFSLPISTQPQRRNVIREKIKLCASLLISQMKIKWRYFYMHATRKEAKWMLRYTTFGRDGCLIYRPKVRTLYEEEQNELLIHFKFVWKVKRISLFYVEELVSAC